MSSIFTGMLLVFLDFNINLGRSKIGLLPDFIGYIVMAGGLAASFRARAKALQR